MKILAYALLGSALLFALPVLAQPRTPKATLANLDTQLVQAARNGSLEQIRSLLNKGANPKAFNGKALENAVETQDPERVRLLTEKGATISFRALRLAIQSGAKSGGLVRILVDAGANINQIGPWESNWRRPKGPVTPLILAISQDTAIEHRGEVVSLLLSKGANPNTVLPNGKTALDFALEEYVVEDIRALLQHGATVGARRAKLLKLAFYSGDAALLDTIRACGEMPVKLSFGEFDLPTKPASVAAILQAHADPNEKYYGWTVLHNAARASEIESIKLLLDAGTDIESKIDISSRNYDGEGLAGVTPAFMTGEIGGGPEGEVKTLEFLLRRGANPNAVESRNGFTVLMWKAIAGRNPAGCIRLLLEYGAKIDAVDLQGQTALHLAATNDATEAMRALLQANRTKAFLEMRDNQGRTALLRALEPLATVSHPYEGQYSFEKTAPTLATLINAGADIRTRNNQGETIFHRAAFNGPEGIGWLEYFVHRGFKQFDVPDKDGATPLFRACEIGNFDYAYALLLRGANPDFRTKRGVSPRQLLSRPFHRPRPQTQTKEEKAYIEAIYGRVEKEAEQGRKVLLNWLNRKGTKKLPGEKSATQVH